MENDKLIHLIYTSVADKNFTNNELILLLTQIRKKNHIAHITGILLYSENNFFQVLEGNSADIENLFARIKEDKRHTKVTQIIKEPIPERVFSEWSMGLVNVTPSQLNSIEGLNDFFTKGTCLANIDMGRSKKLLKAFSNGYWQQTIK